MLLVGTKDVRKVTGVEGGIKSPSNPSNDNGGKQVKSVVSPVYDFKLVSNSE